MRSGSITLFGWCIWLAYRTQPGRWLMAGLSIAIGVALAVAIHTVNRSALTEFNRALDMVNGQASAQVIAPWGLFDDQLFDRIYQQRHALGIEILSPVLEILTDQVPVIGHDLFLAAQVTPALMPLVETGARDDLFAADALFLSPQAMRELNLTLGERIRFQVGFDVVDLRIVGTVPGAIGQSLAVMDLGLAQWRFNQLGKISRIDLKLHQPHDISDISKRLMAFEPNLQLITPSIREQRLSNMSRAYRVNLAVLALVALLTGAFLIFVAVGFSVISQQSQLTLLRTLGASRRWLMSLIVLQGGGVALIGGLFGIFAGYGLAAILLVWSGGDLGAGAFTVRSLTPELDMLVMLGFWVLAVGVGILASYIPARSVLAIEGARQLRAGAAEHTLNHLTKPWPALLLAGLGLCLFFTPAIDGLPIGAYLAIACILLVGVMLTPWLIQLLFTKLLGKLTLGTPSVWAVWRLGQAPSAAASLIVGVVAAVALTVAMMIMIASFRDSMITWLDRVLPADVYSTTQSGVRQMNFSPQLLEQVLKLPEVANAELDLHQPLTMRPDRPNVILLVRQLSHSDPGSRLPLTGTLQVNPGFVNVYISEAMVDLYGWQPGMQVQLPLQQTLSVWVAGVYRDYGRQHGSISIATDDYQRHTQDTRRTALVIWLKPQVSADAFLSTLATRIPELESVKFMTTTEIRELSLTIFDQSFAITYALEFAALLVAIFTVATGFAGQILLRQKELALFAVLGQALKERRAWLMREALYLLSIATVWGSIVGLIISQVLIHRVNPQSFYWTMETHIPYWMVLGLCLVVILAGVGAIFWALGKHFDEQGFIRQLKQD